MSNVRSAQTDKVRFFGNTTPQELAAQYGTPLYVYNEDVLRRRCRELLGLSSLPGFHVNYSAKAQFLFTKGLNLTLSVQSIQPEEVRMQSYDIGAYYETGRFHIEGEYLYKQYSGNAFKDVHAVNTFINYDLPLRKVFNKMSFLLRYDMMTDQSDAKTADEETGRLTVTDYKRQRLTGGITFSLSKAFRTDLRLNYEKYFYAKNSIAKESEQDKVVLELMVRF